MAEFRTDPGDRSVSDLEREVDSERERVSATIDELQSRASMSSIVDQVVKAVGENGGEVSRNLGRSLRENPLAALLTGVGLAWLMAGAGGRSAKTSDTDWESENTRYTGGTKPDWRTFGVAGSETGSDEWVGSGDAFGEAGSYEGSAPSGESLAKRVTDAAGSIGEGVSSTVDGLKDKASGIGDLAGDRLGQVGDAVRQASDAVRQAGGAVRQAGGDAARQAGDAARQAGASVRHQAGAARRAAAGTGRDVREGLDTLLEEQPLVLGAIAMALGAAVGGALPRSRAEDRMFGEQSDRALEKVSALAKEQGAKVQEAASAAVDEAMNIAEEVSSDLGSQLPSAQEIVDTAETRLRDAAGRIRQAAAPEADQSAGQARQPE